LNTPVGVAVDPSGNVWTTNSGENTVSIFLGLATPAVTPLSQNVGP
jgi:DNA-binding beta-propeller fold protein YncE